MVQAANGHTAIIRTERGLTIAGTRITLYDVMDHLATEHNPKLILNWLPLTEAQLSAALVYIEANRAEVEAEYQEVLQTAVEIQQYWESRNREHFAQIATLPPKSESEALWAKLQAQKSRHAAEQWTS